MAPSFSVSISLARSSPIEASTTARRLSTTLLGGIDGLLHITDMAWRRVRHPSEVVQAGQEITAKILKFDTEKGSSSTNAP